MKTNELISHTDTYASCSGRFRARNTTQAREKKKKTLSQEGTNDRMVSTSVSRRGEYESLFGGDESLSTFIEAVARKRQTSFRKLVDRRQRLDLDGTLSGASESSAAHDQTLR